MKPTIPNFKLSKREIGGITLLFLGWRMSLAGLAIIAASVLEYRPSFPYFSSLLPSFSLPQWIYSWANFDGVHYLTIVQKGYFGTGLIQAFFPGYPIMVWLTNHLVNNFLISGLLVSNISFWLFCIMFFSWLKSELDNRAAWIGLGVFLVFPASLFLGAMYGESLFLLTVICAFVMARQRRWIFAGLLAAFAASTRLVGILLVPALLVELFQQQIEALPATKQSLSLSQKLKKTINQIFNYQQKQVLAICLGSLGLAGYMLYLHQVFDDALYFLHVQAEFGAGRSESIIVYPQVVWRYLKILVTYQPHDWRFFAYVQEAVVGVVGVVLLGLTFGKTRWSYWVFSLGVFLIPTLTGTFSSMPRYILPCLVFWLLAAKWLSRAKPWVLVLYLICSAVLLVINSLLFIQGYWVA